MEAYLHASETDLLDLLLWVTAVLMAASMAAWFVCFGTRLHRLRAAARDAATEDRLLSDVLDELADDAARGGAIAQLSRREHAILLRILGRLVTQIKGADQVRLVAMMRRHGFVPAALRVLEQGGPGERQATCQLLVYFDDADALAGLHRALSDVELAVRLTAAKALLDRDQIQSLRELLTELNFSSDDPPLVVAEIFARLPEGLNAQAVELLEAPVPDEWKRMLAIALGRRQAIEAFPAITALVWHPSPRLRAAGWVALTEMGDARAAELLGLGLGDESASVRQAACRCAATTGDAAVLPRLRALQSDSDWWVRFEAAGAMCALGAPADTAVAALSDHAQPALLRAT